MEQKLIFRKFLEDLSDGDLFGKNPLKSLDIFNMCQVLLLLLTTLTLLSS